MKSSKVEKTSLICSGRPKRFSGTVGSTLFVVHSDLPFTDPMKVPAALLRAICWLNAECHS